MKRRHALRHIALISGGLAMIPSCDFSQEDILKAYDKLGITPSKKALLGQLSDTIIPAGEIKGALDLEVHDFVLVMVNDCFSEENQKRFSAGLKAFPAYVKTVSGKAYDALQTKEKETLVVQSAKLKGDDSPEGKNREAIAYLVNTTKRLTIQGYMASEYMQTEIAPYSLIPGEYNGAVLISDLQQSHRNG